MFQLLIAFVSRIYALFLRWMPTNISIRATHSRRGLKWGAPAMLLAAVYVVTAAALARWVDDGGPGWINLLVVVCLWNALKFIVNGPITIARLLRVRAHERRFPDAAERGTAARSMDRDWPLDDELRLCEVCARELVLAPDIAGRHPSIRLDCPEHGPRLMWTPFGDEAR